MILVDGEAADIREWVVERKVVLIRTYQIIGEQPGGSLGIAKGGRDEFF